MRFEVLKSAASEGSFKEPDLRPPFLHLFCTGGDTSCVHDVGDIDIDIDKSSQLFTSALRLLATPAKVGSHARGNADADHYHTSRRG